MYKMKQRLREQKTLYEQRGAKTQTARWGKKKKKKLKIPSCYLALHSEMCHFFVLVNITSFQMGLIFLFSFLINKNLLILRGDSVTGEEALGVIFNI